MAWVPVVADPFAALLAGAGVILVVASLPFILLVVALWRIGTGTKQTALATLAVARVLQAPANNEPTAASTGAAMAPIEQALSSKPAVVTGSSMNERTRAFVIVLGVVVVFIALVFLLGPQFH